MTLGVLPLRAPDPLFGRLVKSNYAGENSTTQTPDLGSSPAVGNLLIFAAAQATFQPNPTAPSGFTEIESFFGGGDLHAIWYYKISEGTEQTASIVWSGGAANNSAVLLEYKWDGSTPIVTSDEDLTNISTVVTSQDSGSAIPSKPKNIVLAGVAADAQVNVFDGQAWTNNFIVDQAFLNNPGAISQMAIARVVNILGEQTTTFTTTDTGDQMYGSIAVFSSPKVKLRLIPTSIAAGGSAIPIFERHYRSMRA